MSDYTLHLGDCRAILPTLAPASIDVVLADPPYGETSLAWDVPMGDWLRLVRRLLKPHGSLWCFGSMRFFMASAGDFSDWTMSQDLIWEKHNGSSFHADRFKRVHEHVCHFYPSDVPWGAIYKQPVFSFDALQRSAQRRTQIGHTGAIGSAVYEGIAGGPRLMRSVLHAQRPRYAASIHPTQKPVELLVPLLEYSCPAGGAVLDPFAGSASVGIAALQRGLTYIGVECDPDYHAKATRRLEDAHAQGSLFEVAI